MSKRKASKKQFCEWGLNSYKNKHGKVGVYALGKQSMEEKIVLCGANAYDKKYYFNQKFDKIPDSIKDELHIICVLFTEEVGGIITFAFDEEGTLVIETNAADEDFYYDEISSGLLVREIRRKKQELFESLSLYYKVVILGEDISSLLEE